MLEVLDSIFLQPLMHLYSLVFAALPAGLGVGWILVLFSVVINVVLMPVYHQMELHSRKTNAAKAAVAREVARLRQHFRGRERYFYIRTVYRQHRYRPLTAVLGSADLFVQILVFATVFRFLSGLGALQGVPFGPIPELGEPDRLLWGVNLLPLLMTGINALSVLTYVENRAKRVQGWALAVLFLVLLYASPSGLVLYWTTNNLFSLIRNLLYRVSGQGDDARLVRSFERIASQH